MQSQATLLGLPFELRTQILTHLLVTHYDPPVNVFTDVPRRHSDYNIVLPRTCPASPAVSLLLVNRQINAEVKQCLEDLKARKEDLVELDVMVRGYWLYPTFTRLPLLQRDVASPLNITLRAFSAEMFLSPCTVGFLTDLLRVFFLFGSRLGSGIAAADETPALYEISKLTVKLEFHDLYTPSTWSHAAAALSEELQRLVLSGWMWPHADSVRFVAKFRHVNIDRTWVVREGEHTANLLEEWRRR